MKQQGKIKLGISIGDLNGIGPEFVLNTFSEAIMLDFCTPVIFASNKALSYLEKQVHSSTRIYAIKNLESLVEGKVNVIDCWNEPFKFTVGEGTEESGRLAIKSFTQATRALKNGEIDVLVTAPISKANIQSQDFKFPGHTDYLAQELEGDAMMLMVADKLKVGLLTDHLPVKEVATAITPELINKKVNTLYKTLKRDFAIDNPKIAVLGINPHVGDNGVIGDDDNKIVIPTLEKMRAEGKIVYGPYAADSFFGSGNYTNFDGIIAAYHDQGLIPFKTLAFGQGVNYTAGLEAIRTSPDHGTAFEIAGKNEADIGSFRQAVYKAIEIYKNRRQYDDLTHSVLKVSPRRATGKSRGK
jgi:4-hydroxythreonine-4-phosphate dehydrogenase